jgi:hypothetical protein
MRVLLLGAVIAVTALFTVGAASSGSRPTAVHFYVAFKDGRLALGLKVTERVHGTCDNGSEVEGRPFVWRCVWGNILADPCFSATATSTSAFCPEAPWSEGGALVLVKRLHGWKPTHPEIISTWPWGVWTTTGKHCIAIRTGTSFVNGMRMNHGCDGGGVLVGPVNRRTTPWTIYYGTPAVASGHSRKLARVGITDAWW